ncbi:MAG TPA: creatininase family protein [Phycisphaerae bacterium]
MQANLSELSWPAAKALLENRLTVGLLPIGAIEAHGPHLPLGTDVFLSLELCRRIAQRLDTKRPCLVLPPITMSVTRFAASFAGTINIRPDIAEALLTDVIAALQRHGLHTLALVNSHLELEHVELLAGIARKITAPRVVFVNHCRRPWALELGEEFKSGDCHAGAYETSLLLASQYAEFVDAEAARRLPAVNVGLVSKMKAGVGSFEAMGAEQAYFGDPAKASVEEGERLWEVLVRMWVEAIG